MNVSNTKSWQSIHHVCTKSPPNFQNQHKIIGCGREFQSRNSKWHSKWNSKFDFQSWWLPKTSLKIIIEIIHLIEIIYLIEIDLTEIIDLIVEELEIIIKLTKGCLSPRIKSATLLCQYSPNKKRDQVNHRWRSATVSNISHMGTKLNVAANKNWLMLVFEKICNLCMFYEFKLSKKERRRSFEILRNVKKK